MSALPKLEKNEDELPILNRSSMPPLAHLSYPSLLFILLSWLLNIHYSFHHLFAIALGCILPDLDLLFFSLLKNKQRKFSPLDFLVLLSTSILPGSEHLVKRFTREERFEQSLGHHSWPTHLPLSYLPLALLYTLKPTPWLGLFCFGVFSHLLLDTTMGKGIAWAWPVLPGKISILPRGERRESDLEFFREYKRGIVYKVDLLATLLLLFFFCTSFWETFI